MRRSWVIVASLGSLLAVAISAGAQAVADAPSARGTLAFDAKANVGDFAGTTTKVTGKLFGASELGSVNGWVEAPVKSLTTHNGHRDSDMAKFRGAAPVDVKDYGVGGLTHFLVFNMNEKITVRVDVTFERWLSDSSHTRAVA